MCTELLTPGIDDEHCDGVDHNDGDVDHDDGDVDYDDGDVDHDDGGADHDGEHGYYDSRIIVTMTTMKPWQVHPAFYSRSCRAHWMAARLSVQV